MNCPHMLGPLPCVNTGPHTGSGRGCVHVADWAPDRRTEEVGDE